MITKRNLASGPVDCTYEKLYKTIGYMLAVVLMIGFADLIITVIRVL